MINLMSINNFYDNNKSNIFTQKENNDPVVPVAIYEVSQVFLNFIIKLVKIKKCIGSNSKLTYIKK